MKHRMEALHAALSGLHDELQKWKADALTARHSPKPAPSSDPAVEPSKVDPHQDRLPGGMDDDDMEAYEKLAGLPDDEGTESEEEKEEEEEK